MKIGYSLYIVFMFMMLQNSPQAAELFEAGTEWTVITPTKLTQSLSDCRDGYHPGSNSCLRHYLHS